MAAREAGIEKLTLLEEPAAAFYSWIANDLAQSQKSSVRRPDRAGLRRRRRHQRLHADPRVARGRSGEFHAHRGGQAPAAGRRQSGSDAGVAGGERSSAKPLSIRQRSGLRRQCAAAKEKLLSDPNLKSVEITVLGGGSSLVGGTLKTEITREEALELALDGFLPFMRARRRAQGRKAQPVPRAGAAATFPTRRSRAT